MSSFIIPVDAFSMQTVSASTGWINLAGGVKAQIDLTYVFSTHQTTKNIQETSTLLPREQYINTLKLEDTTVTIRISLPAPIDQIYEKTQQIPLNYLSHISIPISEFISATISVPTIATVNLFGPASISSISGRSNSLENGNTLSFGDYTHETQYFLNVNQEAKNGDTINIAYDINVNLQLGLSITLLGFQQEIAKTTIGTFSLSPTLTDTYKISLDYMTLLLPIAIVVSIIFVIVYIAWSINQKKKTITNKVISESNNKVEAVSNTKVDSDGFCMYCGTKLPLKASFCRKCGKKQE